jgi:hypothetical protein
MTPPWGSIPLAGVLPPSPPRFGAKKDLLAELLALNQQVATAIEQAQPVTAPGVPKHYPGARKLVTEDYIRPGGVGA